VAQHFPTAIVSGRGRDKVHSTDTLSSWFLAAAFTFCCCFVGAVKEAIFLVKTWSCKRNLLGFPFAIFPRDFILPSK
jgi:hypothetical protein